mgnify:CR=1 FL=1
MEAILVTIVWIILMITMITIAMVIDDLFFDGFIFDTIEGFINRIIDIFRR